MGWFVMAHLPSWDQASAGRPGALPAALSLHSNDPTLPKFSAGVAEIMATAPYGKTLSPSVHTRPCPLRVKTDRSARLAQGTKLASSDRQNS